jgi:hypothetical protein
MTVRSRWAGALLLLVVSASPDAYAQIVERTAQGESGKDIQIGVYVNIRPDCTSGPLPTIRLTEPPAHGKVTVKKASLNATNYKQCLALTAPAYVAFYRADKDFLGDDNVVLEVRYPQGRQETQHITITIRSPGARQPI